MENLKHTKEYAIQLGGKHVETHNDSEVRRMHGHYTRMFADGYMKAIEETGLVDLLEALIEIVKVFDLENLSQGDVKRIEKANNAINKATK